ncbi:UDP-3-O-(3-hydroxymyristoyl)glucosamine N-acyltransferase [Motiliproteus sp. MSK22-1]|uniref:UDP-3-O-(3-hydroxymyristoyl)glucosamine N-acyltransferase n=1 Tax=Motiliproteus sp. MSK22-1 TaxID=1897630 RepID=UPI000978556A|nr:UDP-3-O-(3-hydroxymyristoyl)glucosamine N-acyltransferase [Motiliproteus sp. MSK22-1]OMH39167.1 UDP-3-O-(3-hydroxymyristoyl)glucosamine N-acyltransferase [Motiliproteus sp. MSK22-1]
MVTELTLGEIAATLGARLVGDADKKICGIQSLRSAVGNQISFLSSPAFRADLEKTKAAAVIVTETDLALCPVDALILDDPYLGYARISGWFENRPMLPVGVHSSAVVDATAKISDSARIGPFAVIEADVEIEAGVAIGAHSVIGCGSFIGKDSLIAANVTVYHGVTIGQRVLVHSSAVIGSDGFGFAIDKGRWNKISQLGRVVIGDDVEIGAGTTIDRGALDDTLIGNGVKLDNQIQIAHNVEIGEDSAFAGCVGVAGSSKIGRRCTIAGGVVVAGHLEMADDVHITAMGLVTKSLKKPGVYSSGTGISPHQQWKRNVVRFRQLDQLATRVSKLEKSIEMAKTKNSAD